MTVRQIGPEKDMVLYGGGDDLYTICEWFDGKKQESERFAAVVLEIVTR